jgi:hypothetical protein
MTADQLLVFDLVANALCERELLTINLSALSDIDIGREKFRLEVQRLIKVFGQGVHSPEQSSTAQRVGRTLQANLSSTCIAQLIERQTRASVQAQSAPAFLSIAGPSDVLSHSAKGGSSTKTATTSSLPGSPPHNQNADPLSGGPPIPLQQIDTPVSDASQVRQPIVPPAPATSTTTNDLHLCIEAGSRHF